MSRAAEVAPLRAGRRIARLITTTTLTEWMGVESWQVVVVIRLNDGREWSASEGVDGYRDAVECLQAVAASLRVWETYGEGSYTTFRTAVQTALQQLATEPF